MTEAAAETANAVASETQTVTETETDWKAEAEKWQALSKKNEERAKANSAAAKELEQFKQQSMSEAEKAVAQARAEGLAEGISRGSARVVDAEVRAAFAGRGVNVDAVLKGLDRSQFIGDDGEVDSAAISSWADELAPKEEEPGDTTPTIPDLGQGVRGNKSPLGSDALVNDLKRLVGAE